MYTTSKQASCWSAIPPFSDQVRQQNRAGKRLVRALACLLVALAPNVAYTAPPQLDLPVLWQSELETFTESGPTVADIDGDSHAEVVVAAREEIVVLGEEGKPKWKWKSSGRLMTYPAILSRPGQSSLIYVADYSGKLTCLDGSGKEIWHQQLTSPISWSATVVCDLEGDGQPEVIQTDGGNKVWAFRALTGESVWTTAVDGIPVSPAVGDLNGDGRQEVVVVTGAGRAVAISDQGTVLWNYEVGGASPTWATSAPVIWNDSRGETKVMVASNAGRLVCLDHEGLPQWSHATDGAIASTISVGDFDADGLADIFVITQTGTIYRFDEQGSILWRIGMGGRSLAAGSIIDLDGDGQLEYVLSTQDGRLLVLNQAGEIAFDHQFAFRTINVTPALGDVVPGRPGLEMVLSGGETGRIICLGTQAVKNSSALWTAYRGNEAKTGAWTGLAGKGQTDALSMVPVNLMSDRLHTGDPVRFTIANPDAEALQANVSCRQPNGARLFATSRILSEQGSLELPLDIAQRGKYSFKWSLTAQDGQVLYAGHREISLEPFESDRILVLRSLARLQTAQESVQEKLPSSVEALQRESRSLQRRLDEVLELQGAVYGESTNRQEVLQKTSALVRDAERAIQVADVIEQSAQLGPNTSLVAFLGKEWENRKVDKQLPHDISTPLAIQRTLVQGEYDSISIQLFNVTGRALESRVQIENPQDGPQAIPHRSLPVITSIGESSWDALPELDDSGVITIPSLSNREVWLTVDTGKALPGDYQITMRVQALNGAGVLEASRSSHSVPPPETVIQLSLRILPFEMADSGRLRLCTWAALDGPAIQDMLAHGANVFLAPHGSAKPKGQGPQAGFDFTAMDAVLQPLAGEDVFLLIQGVPSLGENPSSPAYARLLKVYLAAMEKHLADHGIDTEHFALYSIDEPCGAGWSYVEKFIDFGKLVRTARPGLKLYLNGGGEKPMFEALAPYVDIWCPSLPMLADSTPEMKVVRNSKKTVWSYECGYGYARPQGANLKNINIVGQYRTAALFAFHYNASGIGYWCYNIGEDMWGRTALEFPLVYAGRTKPVTSRRWEAVREGVEDFRILYALRERLQTGSLDEETQSRVEHLINSSLGTMISRGDQAVKKGLRRQALDDINNDNTVAVFRKELIECVEALK